MQMITIFVAVVGGFKALEWVIEKITKTHDKSQKIDQNDTNFQEYKAQTDKRIADIQKSISDAHNYAQDNLDEIKKEIMTSMANQAEMIAEDKADYINGINDVKKSITEMSAAYQQTVALIDYKIQTLSDRVEKHNSVVERTFLLERQAAVQEEMIKVANHRIEDLEKK